MVVPPNRGPQYRHLNTIVLISGAAKMVRAQFFLRLVFSVWSLRVGRLTRQRDSETKASRILGIEERRWNMAKRHGKQ